MHTTSSTALPIILASGSPRRSELLTLANVDYRVLSVDIDETPHNLESPTFYIERMVAQKALAAAKLMSQQAAVTGHTAKPLTPKSSLLNKPVNNHIVITADTIGVLPDGVQILVKPNNQQDAFAMWQKMSGVTHVVWTAVQLSVIDDYGHVYDKVGLLEKTQVEFVTLTHRQMLEYWQTGEPNDKAGGYAIQGRGAAWVNAIYGSYTNVVGLPLAQTLSALKALQERHTFR